MTTPTDDPKVKELLEDIRVAQTEKFMELLAAAREVEYDMGKMMLSVSARPSTRLFAAIAAFDPPKPKQRQVWDYDAKVCGNCAYWQMNYPYLERHWHERGQVHTPGCSASNAQNMAECHRYAPNGDAKRPMTRNDDFCGDFTLRLATAKD